MFRACFLALCSLLVGTSSAVGQGLQRPVPSCEAAEIEPLGFTVIAGKLYQKNPQNTTSGLGYAEVDILDFDRLRTIGWSIGNGLGYFSLYGDQETWQDDTYIIRASKIGYKPYHGGATLRSCSTMPFSVTLSWDEYWPPSLIFQDPSAVQSPHGSVPFGARAYSPDGTRYAREVEPQGQGNIAICNVETDECFVFDVIPGSRRNPLKGMAWSRDSNYLAIMYHGGMSERGINLHDAQNGERIRNIGPDSCQSYYYHAMVFSLDNAWVYTGYSGNTIVDQFPSELASKAPSFEAFSGANLPWIRYGWDIGRHPDGAHGGFSDNTAALEDDFLFLAEHGVKVVRVFTFCDLRGGIIFDGEGNPTGFDSYAMDDFDVLVNAAAKYNLKLIPVLFDYMLADGVDHEGTDPVGEHPDLITDPEKRMALISNVFSGLFYRYRYSGVILAWEVMNEPKYATAVPLAELKEFVRLFVQAIHGTCCSKVTLGCDTRGDVANWTDVGLDIYQYHYYDYMEPIYPFDYSAKDIGVCRPVLIGEAQPSNVSGKMSIACDNAYLGILFWSLNADYDFRSVAPEYQAWIESH